MKRYRVRPAAKTYGDDGPDLLRGRENAQHQLAQAMGTAKTAFFTRKNPPGDEPWTEWAGPIPRREVLQRAASWQPNAPDGARFSVGRRSGGEVVPRAEMVMVNVRETAMDGVNAGAELVADLFRAQYPGGDVGGFSCREYNGIPGSGWSDHAWGDAVDLTASGNDALTDWLVRMAKAGCLGGPAQLIGSRRGRVGAFYEPDYAWRSGGPSSHLTHVHCSFRQHYGADPNC